MERISVFCGSSYGTEKAFEKQSYELGKTLAARNIGLVYGGAKVGLMGVVADGALENGGEVIGVLPLFLKNVEIAHENLTELILVKTMHERKMKLNELSDGAIALPGGFGTLEEFFEILTWGMLGLHKKPVALFNINGFYDPLLSFVQTMVDKGFLKDENKEMIVVSDNIGELLEKMYAYKAPAVGKWINKDQI